MRYAPHAFGALIAVIVGIIVIPTVVDFAGNDTDAHGRIDVPGAATLDLPDGDVGVYYGERRRMPSRRRGNTNVPDSLPVPGLDIAARKVDGGDVAELRTGFVEGLQTSNGSRTTKQFAVLEVPSSGDYRVTVRNRDPLRYPDPRLSLGDDSSDTGEGNPVGDWLLDHIKTIVLAAVGLLIAASIVPKFLPGRRGGGPPPPSGPPPGGPPTIRL